MQLEPIERAVLDVLLAGEHPLLVALRRQLVDIEVSERRSTGVGVFTELALAPGAPAAPTSRLVIGDVHVEIDGLAQGAGYLLYAENGFLTTLEAFSYGDAWPAAITSFEVRYVEPTRRALRERLG